MESNLPQTKSDWEKAIRRQSLAGKSIHSSGGIYDSGSNIQLNQFLLLQALWLERKDATNLAKREERRLDDFYARRAKGRLSTASVWRLYLKMLPSITDREDVPDVGKFSPAFYFQQTVLNKVQSNTLGTEKVHSPISKRTRSKLMASASSAGQPSTPTPKGRFYDAAVLEQLSLLNLDSPDDETGPTSTYSAGAREYLQQPDVFSPMSPQNPAFAGASEKDQDEEYVNFALVNFLSSLHMNQDDIGARWLPDRAPFIFKSQKDEKLYEARVDGTLRMNDKEGTIKAIAEVKPCLRSKNNDAIGMQETAQMAAWISSYRPSSDEEKGMREGGELSRRLLISQDRDEIYLTFGSFDIKYLDYVKGEEKPGASFLKLQQYGPFHIRNASHMRCLGQFILGWMLQNCPKKEPS